MEDNTVNTVNQSLLNFQITQHQLDTARDLLSKALAENSILSQQKTENKLIILEDKKRDPYSNQYVTKSKLELDIKDPEVSKVILDAIAKVDTSELSATIEEKEHTIKDLAKQVEEYNDLLAKERSNSNKNRIANEESFAEKTRKLKKQYEDSILDLEIDKETLAKALADLKKDKTQQQIELARQEEIDALTEKLDALEAFNQKVKSEKNPWKLKKLVDNVKSLEEFRTEYPWSSKFRTKVYNAVDRVEAFVEMLKSIGKPVDKIEPCRCTPTPNVCREHWECYACGSDDIGPCDNDY